MIQHSNRKHSARRDLIVLFSFLLLAVAFVSFFDTGSLAEWIARHKDTKIDEAIIASFALTLGLVFSP